MTPRFIRVFLEAKEMPSREVSGYQTPDTSFLETKIITSVLSEFRRRQLQDNQALRPLRHGCNLTNAMSSASLLGQIKLSIICSENVCNVFNNIIQGNVIHQTRPTSSTALWSRSGCSWNTSHLTSSEPNVLP